MTSNKKSISGKAPFGSYLWFKQVEERAQEGAWASLPDKAAPLGSWLWFKQVEDRAQDEALQEAIARLKAKDAAKERQPKPK